MELSVGLIVPKTTCDTRGRGDVDRTGTKGQQWAYCLEQAWYNPTATEWYQAKTTASFSPTLCPCVQLPMVEWQNNNGGLVSVQSPHPSLHSPQFHIWRRLPPHLRELNNYSLTQRLTLKQGNNPKFTQDLKQAPMR